MSTVARKTMETSIRVELNIDGFGDSNVKTGIGFFDHMLSLWAKHGLFDLNVEAGGDLHVDGHHTVEDVGITIGQAFSQALGNKKGIKRYGECFTPMDEALVLHAVDICGRPFLACDLNFSAQKLGMFETELVEEFLRAFCMHSGLTLHVKQMAGKNSHHIIEAAFKGLGRALKTAVTIDERIIGLMTTKGSL